MELLSHSLIGLSVGGFHVGDIVFAIVSFAILLGLLKKYAWAPMLGKMEERENYIANELDVAEKNRVEAEKATLEANENLNRTRQEAQSIIDEAKKAGVKQEEAIIQSAEISAEKIKEAAREEIRQEKDRAIEALQEQVASLSVQIATKVIEKEINVEDQERLISDYMKQIGEE